MELKEGSFKKIQCCLCSQVALDLSLPSMAGWPKGQLICAVGTLGCRLGRLAAGQYDCLIWCPLKAM